MPALTRARGGPSATVWVVGRRFGVGQRGCRLGLRVRVGRGHRPGCWLGALVFELANADTGNAGGIGDFIMGQAFQVVWVCVLKKAAAAVTTLTVTNATLGVAITDAISLNQADTMEVRPASIGVASAVSPRLAAGDTLRLTKSAANCACRVLVIGIPG
jgi:hypothetical protein